MNVLFVAPYPDEFAPYSSVFVYNLVQELSAQGTDIEVVSPQNWWKGRTSLISEPGDYLYGSERATVIRPKYLDLPNRIRVRNYALGRLNVLTYRRAVRRVLWALRFKPDIVYAHFLYRAGPAALTAARYFDVPAVVALGESSFDTHRKVYTDVHMRRLLHQFDGIISVSHVNKLWCVENAGVPEEKCEVIPNAVDRNVFYPRDKLTMRRKYHLPERACIIVFVGHFIERKGPLRVLAALERLPDNVYGVFVGEGPQKPHGRKVLFAGSVPQWQVPELLCSADLFVLPTLNEGSCNALAEAMACGLPVVSADIEAVREQVGCDVAELIDPESVEEIANAIRRVVDDGTLGVVSKEERGRGQMGDLTQRAQRIRAFLERCTT